jgi:hypothetical protein
MRGVANVGSRFAQGKPQLGRAAAPTIGRKAGAQRNPGNHQIRSGTVAVNQLLVMSDHHIGQRGRKLRMITDWIFKVMRLILEAMALVLGSASILALWASFYIPSAGGTAFMMLVTAAVIKLGLPERQRQARAPRWP